MRRWRSGPPYLGSAPRAASGKDYPHPGPSSGVPRHWLGCSGWAYDDWVGPFYPAGTPASEFLVRYARVFPTVEVDSSFYRSPAPSVIRRWADRTPTGFRFSLKIPREVTHPTRGSDPEGTLARFLEGIRTLEGAGKLGPIVLQFPPSFRARSESDRLVHLLGLVPRERALAVELRHESWWTGATRRALESRGAALVWSVVPSARFPPWVTADFLYLRWIGDRTLTRFDRLQRDASAEMEEMRHRLDEHGAAAATVYSYANNHFMGFGPGTVAAWARTLGEDVPDLGRAARAPGQATLDRSP